MLNKWAFLINIFAFILLAVLLIFQVSEISVYFDGVGNIGELFK